MGGGIVEGAALGTAFEMLFKSVVKATQQVARFGQKLNRLATTLSSIKPAMDDVESFNKILGRPQHETEAFTLRLVQGEKLIRKCSKVKRFNVFTRLKYANKLSSLEASLVRFFQIEVAALHLQETKRISVIVSDLEGKMNEITTMMRRISEFASAETHVVGLDEQSCKEILKEEGGGSLVEHSAS